MAKVFLTIIALINLGFSHNLKAQQTFTASISNHAISMPGGSFRSPFHPGVDLGWVMSLHEGQRWDRMAIFRLGYFHQRLVHHGFQLYGEYTWRYNIYQGLAAEAATGIGYLHTLEMHQIFQLQEDGTYEQVGRWGKPHIQASAAIGFSFAPTDWLVRPFLMYRFTVMAPFVKEYVPILPATSLHIGTYFSLPKTAKS